MSSKKVEDVHTELIKKLLQESGLVCLRSPRYSEESEEQEEEEEEAVEEEEVALEEQKYVEEVYQVPEEMVAEEFSDIFPTPSLRRLIPERVRRIEAQNRIRTLPDNFNTTIDPEEIPRIIYTAPKVYIDKLAQLTGCKKHPNSLPEYWFLDTLANLLRRAQEDDFTKPAQAVLILWFCEWMREMQHFDAAKRERMMKRWKDNMLAAAKVIAEEDIFPSPENAGVYYKMKDSTKTQVDSAAPSVKSKTALLESGGFVYECAMKDLSRIIHYIYDLIGTDFQYDLIRSIYTFSPEYRLIHGPFQLELPKRLYGTLKPKKEVKPPKSKDKDKEKDKKDKGGKKKEMDTEEYLALMQLIQISNQEDLEREELDREEWNRRNSILPLGFAVTPEFFEQYWPLAPEPTPSPTAAPAAEPKKGKK